MNKTVNINLAGIFFHIDEDAYARLQRYLETIKRSFSETQGRDEIISDIEARIAELFNEKIQDKRQVIGIKEVEAVIAVMGQPEDYMVDEEIFDDAPKAKTTSTRSVGKQLFRDTEHGYIGGVSSGLGHYMGIDAIWVRILWVLLTIFSSGAFILIYIAFWIFVPEAKTTADKLSMRGEEVNVSNIEKKIREGFHEVSDSIKSVDYEKYGSKARAGANSAATTLGGIIKFCLKLIVKFIGVMLILTAGSAVIALFIAFFVVGTFGIVDAPWTDYLNMMVTGAPLWVISLLSFFAIGIPFFFLFVLGLKILVRNLRSIGRVALLTLLGLWLLSVIGLTIIGISQATNRAFDAEVVQIEKLGIKSGDTLTLRMNDADSYYRTRTAWRGDNFPFVIKKNEQGQNLLFSNDIRLIVNSTKDSVGKIEIIKSSEGKDYQTARDRAESITYQTSFVGKELLLNNYFSTGVENKFRDQKIQITIFLPEGTVLLADENTAQFHYNSSYFNDILMSGQEGHYLEVRENEAYCEDCPEETWMDEEGENMDQNWEDSTEASSGDEWDSSDDFNSEPVQQRSQDSTMSTTGETSRAIDSTSSNN